MQDSLLKSSKSLKKQPREMKKDGTSTNSIEDLLLMSAIPNYANI